MVAYKRPYKTDPIRVPGRCFNVCGAVHTEVPDEILVGSKFPTECYRPATALHSAIRDAWVGACKHLGEDVEVLIVFG